MRQEVEENIQASGQLSENYADENNFTVASLLPRNDEVLISPLSTYISIRLYSNHYLITIYILSYSVTKNVKFWRVTA